MSSLWAVFGYEWRRGMTPGRIGWWFVLTLFPALIVLMIRWQPQFGRGMQPEEINTVWSIVFYLLIPCVCCVLGVFLNAAPAIAAELEQRSWVYLATRPRGILWLMLGKYLVAVVWAVISALLSISIAAVVSQLDFQAYRNGASTGSLPASQTNDVLRPLEPGIDGKTEAEYRQSTADAQLASRGGVNQAGVERSAAKGSITDLLANSVHHVLWSTQGAMIRRTWVTMVKLSVLSAIAYASLFLMIGAMFPKRAMVFCVAYIALVEVVLSLIPAVINRMTFQYRLRSLMINWADPVGQDQMQGNMFFRYVFADGGNTEQVTWMIGLACLFLLVALLVAQKREFTAAAESDL